MKNPDLFDKNGESIEFSGKCVVALATDPNIMNKSGQIITNMQIAKEYNLKDENHGFFFISIVKQKKFNNNKKKNYRIYVGSTS